jgi:hypothetical protein
MSFSAKSGDIFKAAFLTGFDPKQAKAAFRAILLIHVNKLLF